MAACGSDDGGPTVTSTGAGGGGGAGGGQLAHPWDKPLCDDPGKPLGGTPATRSDTAGALNADATEMVIFGGDSAKPMCPNIPPRIHEGDTWILDIKCGAWEQLAPAVSPPARARHVMVQDHERGRALLFGGRWRDNNVSSGAYTLYNDLWAFDFATREWTEIATTGTGPTPRANTGAALVGNEMIVFGGNTSTSGINFIPNNDTYALNLDTNEWRQLNTAAAPPARLFHTMTSDSEGGRVFIGTGGDENAFVGPFLTDYWVLDVANETWAEIPSAPTFAPAELQRIKAGLMYRPETEHGPAGLVAFGGHDNLTPFFDVRNDVRFLDLTGLTLPPAGPYPFGDMRIGDVYETQLTDPCSLPVDYVVTDMEAPERRDGFAMGVAHGGGAFVVFGGNADCDRLSDSWWFNTATGEWTPIRESLAGISCPRTGNPSCNDLCG
jgi:hypothetical protein